MTAVLCRDRPPEWWTPGDDGARLAVLICRRCTGCPTTDPAPAGVILRGVGYSDSGAVLPQCGCGRPCDGYRGGDARCTRCAEPNLPLFNVRAARDSWLEKLHERGMTDRQIGEEAGMHPKFVQACRSRHRKRQGTQPPGLDWLNRSAPALTTHKKEAM